MDMQARALISTRMGAAFSGIHTESKMSLAGIYFSLALLSVYCTFTAIVQARKLYWFVPVYFFSAWLCGELALIHLIWQLGLTALFVIGGVLADPLAQTGLGLFVLAWLGLVYLHCQAARHTFGPRCTGLWAVTIALPYRRSASMSCAMTL